MRRADFHTHSTASDGTLAPAELVAESARRGLTHIALTDHDTTSGVVEALDAGRRAGVTVIPGVELSAAVQRGELHILGYGIDPEHRELQSTLEELRQTRQQRADRILERLREIGVDLPADALERAGATESIGRPHIARALIEAGVVASISEGFDQYLGWGRPAFVPKPLLPPADAIDLIRSAGGIAVMAHPYSAREFQRIIPELVAVGLGGIESYYGEYDDVQRSTLATLARERGLLATGGSDYHGPGVREGRELGSVTLPDEAIAALLEAVRR